jgi:hypothetical protein
MGQVHCPSNSKDGASVLAKGREDHVGGRDRRRSGSSSEDEEADAERPLQLWIQTVYVVQLCSLHRIKYESKNEN